MVSYTTSPAAEVFYSDGALTTPPTGNVLGADSAFLQIEGIGILEERATWSWRNSSWTT